eukprot:scaffold6870_cov121-Cylindrotheca_fusiformis.AAC.17
MIETAKLYAGQWLTTNEGRNPIFPRYALLRTNESSLVRILVLSRTRKHEEHSRRCDPENTTKRGWWVVTV